MLPSPAKLPPTGPEWLYEAKFDGFRAQIHVEDDDVALFSRYGNDLIKRFRTVRPILQSIPVRSAIIDCELVACGDDGMPCFNTLMDRGNAAPAPCLWCFDLLALNGVRLTLIGLEERKGMLADVINLADHECLQFSGEFSDPLRFLAAGEKTGLEGIVSKRRDSPYRSGPTKDWLKTKTAAWRAANRNRFDNMRSRPTA
jgi:bifunctional non-homologous end joining protein LigD